MEPLGSLPLPAAMTNGGLSIATVPELCSVTESWRRGLAPNHSVHDPVSSIVRPVTSSARTTAGSAGSAFAPAPAGTPTTVTGALALPAPPMAVNRTTHGQGTGGAATRRWAVRSPAAPTPAFTAFVWSQSADPRRASLPQSSTSTSVFGAKPAPCATRSAPTLVVALSSTTTGGRTSAWAGIHATTLAVAATTTAVAQSAIRRFMPSQAGAVAPRDWPAWPSDDVDAPATAVPGTRSP